MAEIAPRSAPAEPPSESRARELVALVERGVDPRLVVLQEPQSGLAEQYRSFRTNLLALNPEGQPRALAIASAIQGEGKSVTTANLAIALAELPDTRVLLVDADLRAPAQARLFGREGAPGLSDLMLGTATPEQAISNTTVNNLALLPAGSGVRNPSELLGSARIRDVVGAFKAEYQWILFDTPAALPFADAATLGARLDGVIWVVRLEKTPRDQTTRALELLRNAGCNVLGSFLAGARVEGGGAKAYVLPDD